MSCYDIRPAGTQAEQYAEGYQYYSEGNKDKETLLREIITGRLNVSSAEKKCREILATGRKQHGTIIKYFNDITVFVNSIEKTINTMLSSGISARCKRRETETTVDYLISIPKNG